LFCADLAQQRTDFVLQESFDLSSVRAHTSYWDCHDTALFVLHALMGDAARPVTSGSTGRTAAAPGGGGGDRKL
jgi:hypothetical protein